MPNWPTSTSMNANGLFLRMNSLVRAIPAARVRYLILVATAVWFLSLLADLVWMLVPVPRLASSETTGAAALPATVVSKPRAAIDMIAMQSWYLFGSGLAQNPAELKPDTGETNVPENASLTSLQLVLLGALQSDIPEESYAIIQTPDKAVLIKVGENIPVGDNIVLAKVLVDRVIINNRGRMESLLLYAESGLAEQPTPQASTGKKVLDQRNNPELSMMANNYRNQLMTNPMSLTDVIKVSIAKDNEGKIMGYRIRPGRDRDQFAKFGLQSGDIVTAINGVTLDDPAKAMELYGQLREAREATFLVKRGNDEISLIVGLSQ